MRLERVVVERRKVLDLIAGRFRSTTEVRKVFGEPLDAEIGSPL
jgi:hypothetical protein